MKIIATATALMRARKVNKKQLKTYFSMLYPDNPRGYVDALTSDSVPDKKNAR